MPRHNRSTSDWFDYLIRSGYSVSTLEDYKEDVEERQSMSKTSKELNALPFDEKRKRGISNDQVCILTCVDRNNGLYLAPVCNGRMSARHIDKHLSGKFSEDAVLVTDSHSAYREFARKNKLQLEQIPPGTFRKGAFNLARVDSCHSRLDSYFNGYRGIASKYSDHYLALFRWQDKHRSESTQSKVTLLKDMLTERAERIFSKTLKYKPMPFELKSVAFGTS